MSRINTHLILLTGAVLTFLSACTQNDVFQGAAGDGVLTARIEGTVTKTSYDSIEGKFAWTAGDEIALHYTTGGYTTYAVNPADGSVNAAATATNYRNYYAVYPATAAVAANYGNPALQVTLPDSYDFTDIVAGNKTADFSPVPMVAINDINNSFLDFYHVGGLFRLICQGVPAGAKTIKITADKDITGTYTVNNLETFETSAPAPTISTAGRTSGNTVTFTISEAGLEAQQDITLNFPVPCGTYTSITIEGFGDDTAEALFSRTFSSKPFVFERHHGKKLNVMEIVYDFFMTDLTTVSINAGGGNRTLAQSFVSYKTDGTDIYPVPFILEFSEDNGENWSETAPEWLILNDDINYDGTIPANAQNIGLRIIPQQNSAPDPHHDVLSAEDRQCRCRLQRCQR